MADFEDWLNTTGAWVAVDRPDLYADADAAVADLRSTVERMRRDDSTYVGFASYVINRFTEDGEELEFSKKVTLYLDGPPGEERAYELSGNSVGFMFVPHLPDIFDDSED